MLTFFIVIPQLIFLVPGHFVSFLASYISFLITSVGFLVAYFFYFEYWCRVDQRVFLYLYIALCLIFPISLCGNKSLCGLTLCTRQGYKFFNPFGISYSCPLLEVFVRQLHYSAWETRNVTTSSYRRELLLQ